MIFRKIGSSSNNIKNIDLIKKVHLIKIINKKIKENIRKLLIRVKTYI